MTKKHTIAGVIQRVFLVICVVLSGICIIFCAVECVRYRNTLILQIGTSLSESTVNYYSELITALLNNEQAVQYLLDEAKTYEKLATIDIITQIPEHATTCESITPFASNMDIDSCVQIEGSMVAVYQRVVSGGVQLGYIRKTKVINYKYGSLVFQLALPIFLWCAGMLLLVQVVKRKLHEYVSYPLSVICNDPETALKNPRFGVKQVEEVTILARALHQAHIKIETNAHLAAIGQSTAMVAHDVRRPLTSMKALLNILSSIKDDPAQLVKMTAHVDQTITRTNTMLNEIMDFSKDATALELKECAPKVIFASAVSEALRNHPEADVEIAYELDSEHVFHCDVARVMRVFANLIDNALGAMEGKGRGKLHIKTGEEVKDSKRFIVAQVRDSGGGIPEEYLSKIFDPFFTKGKKGGTGLGLAICQKIANMHGGEISAWNIPDMGAVFSVKIPAGATKEVVEDDEQNDLIHDSKELQVFRVEETKREFLGDTANIAEFMRINKERGRISTLLVVDDEPLFRETIRSMLNTLEQVKDHVKVIEADSAEKALNIFETCKFDYVIADIDLGRNKMNGYKLTQDILEKYPNTHVLMHSNKRREEMDEKIRVAASDYFLGFLPKPMKADELLQFLACKSFETACHSERSVGAAKNPVSSQNLKTVLFLNDDTDFCFSVKMQLRSPHAQVLDVHSVSEAIKYISQNKVDAIISDINLGDGEPSGYEFLKKVRETDTEVPFYFMSGYSKNSEWPKADKLGATGYFQLPFCVEDTKKELEI